MTWIHQYNVVHNYIKINSSNSPAITSNNMPENASALYTPTDAI